MKFEYNTLIKSFNKMTRDLMNFEVTLEDIERKISSNKDSQKFIFYQVNSEFVTHFLDNFSRLNHDIREFLMKCFGCSFSNISLLKVNK